MPKWCLKKWCKNDAKMKPKWSQNGSQNRYKNQKMSTKIHVENDTKNWCRKKVAKRRFWMPFRFPGVLAEVRRTSLRAGKVLFYPIWQRLDTGRCRRILGPLENPKSLQNRIFEARFEFWAPKMISERVSGDSSKNPWKINQKMMDFWVPEIMKIMLLPKRGLNLAFSEIFEKSRKIYAKRDTKSFVFGSKIDAWTLQRALI